MRATVLVYLSICLSITLAGYFKQLHLDLIKIHVQMSTVRVYYVNLFASMPSRERLKLSECNTGNEHPLGNVSKLLVDKDEITKK